LITALPVSVAGPILRISSGVGRTCPTVHRGLPITVGCPRHVGQGYAVGALAPPLVNVVGGSAGYRRRHPTGDVPGIAEQFTRDRGGHLGLRLARGRQATVALAMVPFSEPELIAQEIMRLVDRSRAEARTSL
jgi:hypothetical protein